MYYLIRSTLTEVPREKLLECSAPYVAVLTRDQWLTERQSFDMGIDIDPFAHEIHSTKAEVNYDSLTGSFSIPNRVDLEAEEIRFAFALDEKGVVFIDDSGYAAKCAEQISRSKRWRLPSLERFLYDFLEQIVAEDRDLIERYDRELDTMEDAVNLDKDEDVTERLGEIRSHIRDLRIHYEHLIDFTQELEENENNFFIPENPGGNKKVLKNIVYRDNLVESCVYSIEYFLEMNNGDTESYMENIEMCGNILRNSGYGWGQQRHNIDTPAHIKGWSYTNQASNYRIHHNLFDRAAYRMLHLVAKKQESCPEMWENTYIQHRSGMIGQYGGNEIAEPEILLFDDQAEEKITGIFGDRDAVGRLYPLADVLHPLTLPFTGRQRSLGRTVNTP